MHEITLERAAVSAVILAQEESSQTPHFTGVKEALSESKTDIRLFGKPNTRKYRRMGVSLVYDQVDANIEELRVKARTQADKVSVT